MLRIGIGFVVAGVYLWAAAAHAQGEKSLDDLVRLFRGFEDRDLWVAKNRPRRVALLREIGRLKDEPRVVPTLVKIAREELHADVREVLYRQLVQDHMAHPLVLALLEEVLASQHPWRSEARRHLLERAVKQKEARLPLKLFKKSPDAVDRFMAVEALGKIRSPETVDLVHQLLEDPSWRVIPGTAVRLSTLARSLSHLEEPASARALLLLQRDPRFLPKDAAAVRSATRLWRKPDLLGHVDLSALAASEESKRIDAARFLGRAGIESARAPLVRIAFNRREPAAVRAAAATALGGLRIARSALAKQLERLLREPDPAVQRGALAGLGNLRIRSAVALLVEHLRGRLAPYARRALSKAFDKPVAHDWVAWFQKKGKDLPEGA